MLAAPSTAPEAPVAPVRTRRSIPPDVVALVGFVVLLPVFHPYAVLHLGTRMLSDGFDGASFLWSYWQVPHAVANFENPFSTDLMFHPIGVPLAFHTGTPIESILIGALGGIIGITLAVNLVMLGAVVASGMGAYLLALHERASRPAAFFAGVAFAFLPARLLRIISHHNLNHTWILPFGLLALLVVIERPSRRRALLLGAMFGVAILTDFTLTGFLGLATLIVLVWRRREIRQREVAVRLVQAAGVAAIVGLPVLVNMVTTITRGELDPLRGWSGAEFHSSDLLSWVIPPKWNRLWGKQFLGFDPVTGSERIAYPGLVVLLLAAIGAFFLIRGRTRTVWIAISAVFFVLSLGPFLKVNGHSGTLFKYLGTGFSVPLPYLGLHFVPILNGLRIPGRFSIMAALGLAVLAALALTRLAAKRPALTWALPAVALAVLVAELISVPAAQEQSPKVPQPYERIAADRTERAVLEIPIQWRHGLGSIGDGTRDHTIFLYYATRHRHPMVSGMVARLPKRRLDKLLAIPVYRQLLTLQHQPGMFDLATFTVDDLRRLDIGFVVYHRDRPMPDVRDYVAALGLPVVARDRKITVWEVPAARGAAGERRG